jgi:hypothetical protein
VAEELLDRREIGAGVEEVPGVAAPQVMGRDAGEAGTESASRQELADRLAGEAAADFEVAGPVDPTEKRAPHLAPQLEPGGEEGPGAPGQRHQALLVSLAHHPQRGRLEVDVGDVESGNL